MVVPDMEGVVKLLPVPNDDPPVEAAYQFMVPAEAVAPKLTVPVPHLDTGVEPVIVGMALIVAVTAVRDAVVQPLLVASA